MNSPSIGVCVLAKNREDARLFRKRNTYIADAVHELLIVVNPGAQFGGLGKIGDKFFRQATSDIVGIVHADTIFCNDSIETIACDATSSVVGIVGRNINSEDVVSKLGGGEVSTLDSCAVFIPRQIYGRAIAFDTVNFDGFHCCIEDLCIQAHCAEIPRIVSDVGADHWARIGSRPVGWMEDYWKYRDVLKTKWAQKKIQGTFIFTGPAPFSVTFGDS